MIDASGAEPYERMVSLYDWEHDQFDDDLPLYRALAKRTGGPILELGCGTARIMADLAARGYACYGVDASDAMLAGAHQRLDAMGAQASLIMAPMQAFTIPELIELALIPLDTFGHLLEQEDQLLALRAVRTALSTTGLLVIDLSNGNNRGEPRDELVHHLTAESADGSALITKWVSRSPDPATQIDELTYWYDVTEPDGLLRRTTVQFSLRYFTRYELTLLLERAGFEVEALYGSYDLEPFGPMSDRLIAIARPSLEPDRP